LAVWDRLVDAAPGSDVAQLSSWARFREGYGYQPLYLFVFESDTLLGGAQILHRRVPAIGELGYVPYGPVITGPDHIRPDVLDTTNSALAELARRRFRMLFVQPPRAAHEISHHLTTLGFRASAADLAPAGSVHIDLDPDEDDLRKMVSKSQRRRVSKWAELGVEVRVGDHDDIPLLARMLADSAAHRGFEALGEPYLRGLYGALSETARAVLFVGEVGSRPVAASLATLCGATVRARIYGMHRCEETRRLRVPAAVEWETIRWAKHNGYRWYDLGGLGETPLRTLVDGAPADHATWDGADRFKLQFGGTAYRYPTPVEMIRPWPLRLAYDLSRRSPGGRTLVRQAAQRLRGGRSAAAP
jgi:lipid II:glycine glycyltransferase (peptidoglycan interpeptide bridge formation enzyme)